MLVLAAILDVSRYRGSDDLGHRAILNGSDGFKRFGLIRRQPNRHRFRWLHIFIMIRNSLGCQQPRYRGIMVSDGDFHAQRYRSKGRFR